MVLCEQAKRTVFGEVRGVEATWEQRRMHEKEYTLPTKPVLFDDLERYFINLGVVSPHMYFHKSPGLLRLKARSGLKIQTVTNLTSSRHCHPPATEGTNNDNSILDAENL